MESLFNKNVGVKDFSTEVFLSILRNIKEHCFYRTACRFIFYEAFFKIYFRNETLSQTFVRGLTNKINSLHEEALGITYGDESSSSFRDLLKKDNSSSVP